MSTFSSAIKYTSTTLDVSTGNVAFGSTSTGNVLYTNSNSQTKGLFIAYSARCTVTGGAGAALDVALKLQCFDHNNSTWYDANVATTSASQAYASVGTQHPLLADVTTGGLITYDRKIEVPPYHRVVAAYHNGGTNSATWRITGVIEQYLSQG